MKTNPDIKDRDVTDVTDVQTSDDAYFPVTSEENTDVTDVTRSEIPASCFKVFDNGARLDTGEFLVAGVWYFSLKQAKKDDDATLHFQFVCSPLHVEAVTFDEHDNNFGRLVRFKNTLGRWKDWAMPMELLRGSGDDLRGELLAMGVHIDPAAKSLLANYLFSANPERKVRCALKTGWSERSFVLPDEVIGPDALEVIFQSGERGHDEYTKAGTLEDWISEIPQRATGNPTLIVSLSAGFAGPLLGLCNQESGGFHFVGHSSIGKTAKIEAACSIWGGPAFKRSWRATANGTEGAAVLCNDALLAMDEISECEPREVGQIVYALGNGQGKQRASRTGRARQVARWRCVVLSSGERTIATSMAEGGFRAKAGQSARILDIDVTRKYGCWDDLHGFQTGAAFTDAIKKAATTHYGHAGRAFLERLTKDETDFAERLEAIKSLDHFQCENEGQHKRAAARFALIAMAGELATEYGLTGWEAGAAIEAASELFNQWIKEKGQGKDEPRQILDALSTFIQKHGDSRFSCADDEAESVRTINRAGWWRSTPDGRIYLFTKAGMHEALTGFDFRRSLDILSAAGVLPATGERAKPLRIQGRPTRLYEINPALLEDAP